MTYGSGNDTTKSGNTAGGTINYSSPKSSLTNHINNLDDFVVLGTQNGEPRMWTSASDQRQVKDLFTRAAPQFVSELSG